MKRLILLLGLLVMLLVACTPKPSFTYPCEGCVPKVNPNGYDPDRDLKYSVANGNNGEGDALSGQAAESFARATQIVEETNYGTLASKNVRIGFFGGSMVGFWGCLFFGFFVLLPGYIFLNSRRFGGSKGGSRSGGRSQYDMEISDGKRKFTRR
jgi:hypothetical protein